MIQILLSLGTNKMVRIKKCNDELKATRPTKDEISFIPRIPVSILVENVRSVYNVGSIFRSADGAEDVVPWEYYSDPIDAVKHIKKTDITLALVEQTQYSKSIYDIDWQFPICFIVGNEGKGVSEEVSKLADVHVELPMRGVKQSLNVSVAAGVVVGRRPAIQVNQLAQLIRELAQ